MTGERGKPSTNDWRVGRTFRVGESPRRGRCVSVTRWGNNRVRWVRLRLADGTESSFAPSHLMEVDA